MKRMRINVCDEVCSNPDVILVKRFARRQADEIFALLLLLPQWGGGGKQTLPPAKQTMLPKVLCSCPNAMRDYSGFSGDDTQRHGSDNEVAAQLRHQDDRQKTPQRFAQNTGDDGQGIAEDRHPA